MSYKKCLSDGGGTQKLCKCLSRGKDPRETMVLRSTVYALKLFPGALEKNP